jgi:Domain of unknown function (DUF4160)
VKAGSPRPLSRNAISIISQYCGDRRRTIDHAATIAYHVGDIRYLCRRFAACKIAIYADDHMPPHFHIEGRGFRAVVEIETMAVRAGDVR